MHSCLVNRIQNCTLHSLSISTHHLTNCPVARSAEPGPEGNQANPPPSILSAEKLCGFLSCRATANNWQHERIKGMWASRRLTTQSGDDATINGWHSDDRRPQKRVGKHSPGGPPWHLPEPSRPGHSSSGRLEPAKCTKAVIGHNSLSS